MYARETPLEPLTRPVYFVFRDRSKVQPFAPLFPSFNGGEPRIDVPPAALYWNRWDGETAWIINTFLQLRRRGIDARLVDRFVPGELCVVTYDDLARPGQGARRWWRSFVVCCQMDRARPTRCHARITQNRTAVDAGGPGVPPARFIRHWPQLSLTPRRDERGDRVENMVFHGERDNLLPAFRDEGFVRELRGLGVTFRVHPLDKSRVAHAGRDWSDTDLVLAVRGGTEHFRSIKPALKLVNAWQAGAVALLGPEAGYREERQSELDYLEVRTPREAIDAVSRLVREPGLFGAMCANGRRRALEYAPDAIAQAWRAALDELLRGDFARWRGKGPLAAAMRTFRGACSAPARAIAHTRERNLFWKRLGARSYRAAAAMSPEQR